jgi:hypothetical protein
LSLIISLLGVIMLLIPMLFFLIWNQHYDDINIFIFTIYIFGI